MQGSDTQHSLRTPLLYVPHSCILHNFFFFQEVKDALHSPEAECLQTLSEFTSDITKKPEFITGRSGGSEKMGVRTQSSPWCP